MVKPTDINKIFETAIATRADGPDDPLNPTINPPILVRTMIINVSRAIAFQSIFYLLHLNSLKTHNI
jgi:hypothetical protein